MARTTQEIHLTTNLDHSEFQARAADDLRDLLESVAVLWADRKDADRRRLLARMEAQGVEAGHAEQAVEQYHRAVRLLIDALSTSAHAAKVVGDCHATMIGALNSHRRHIGLSPISGLSLQS